MRLVSVAVPVPALDTLTYSLPDGFPVPPPGARVDRAARQPRAHGVRSLRASR